MSLLLGALVVVVAALVVGAVALARTSKRTFEDANVIVPGVDTGAPAAWAGAHSPEALLHRRIRDAVRALAANADLGGPLAEARSRLEAEAVAIDRRLVAASALPESVRAEPLARVATAVEALEQAAADAALGAHLTDEQVIGDTTAAITERLTALAEARAELERDFSVADPVVEAEEVIDPTPQPDEGTTP